MSNVSGSMSGRVPGVLSFRYLVPGALVALSLMLVAASALAVAPTSRSAGIEDAAGCDFNGDGYSDLAVGVGESFDGAAGAGAVNVIYGTVSGLRRANAQFWHPDIPGIKGNQQAEAGFGGTVVCGDFNGDGYDDLGASAAAADVGDVASAGAVNVIYGSGTGLAVAGNQLWHQGWLGIKGTPDGFDLFGLAQAAGDFNGDGFDDLAVGAPLDTTTQPGTGAVNVIYGSASGLTAKGDQYLHQDKPGIKGQATSGDYFGISITAGDFDGDTFDDLAIGSYAADEAGAVNVIYGSDAGLTRRDQYLYQGKPGIKGVADGGEHFGASLSTGDFNGDGNDDLVVGAPRDKPLGEVPRDAGAVHVIYGSASGLTAKGDQYLHQDRAGVKGAIQPHDFFGTSPTSGDFNGDGIDDLAIGVPNDRAGGIEAGAVNILFGSGSGLTALDDQRWHQNSPEIRGAAESGDGFGTSLHSGDFDGDGIHDLAVGVPMEDVGDLTDAGAVNVLYGGLSGLSAVWNQIWTQSKLQVGSELSEPEEFFGWLDPNLD